MTNATCHNVHDSVSPGSPECEAFVNARQSWASEDLRTIRMGLPAKPNRSRRRFSRYRREGKGGGVTTVPKSNKGGGPGAPRGGVLQVEPLARKIGGRRRRKGFPETPVRSVG